MPKIPGCYAPMLALPWFVAAWYVTSLIVPPQIEMVFT